LETTSSNLSFTIDKPTQDIISVSLQGSLDSSSTATIWKKLFKQLRKKPPQKIIIIANGLEYVDGSGFGLLRQLELFQTERQNQFVVQGLAPDIQKTYDLFGADSVKEKDTPKMSGFSFIEGVGRAVVQGFRDFKEQISFIGELNAALVRALLKPHKIRWKEVLSFAEAVGVNALPIAALLGFLMGLIMAFQAAQPMRQFGADIFVANLVAISMVRELGPLMTAIVLAGRSGSAFAAELGTMTVNEEINALRTMGLKPVPFLVVVRVLAAVIMMPFLTIFTTFFGLIGGAVVMLSLGYPLVTYVNQIVNFVTLTDFAGGLVKAFAFGILVASIGCLRGLQTGSGAKAVGESTTSAVVSGLLLIVICDGVFSVAYYYLGI